MEIREIAGDLFVVTKVNRREDLVPPGAAKAAAQTAISEAEGELRDFARQADELRVQIEEAAFFDEPTTDLRAQLNKANQAAEAARAKIGAQRRLIGDINAGIDRHNAARIAKEHAAHLAAIVAPFESILKEIHQ